MDLFNKRWKKINKKIKDYLYESILFLILTICCFGWAYSIEYHLKSSSTLHELISNGSKKEKDIVSLTITERPYAFAEAENDSDSVNSKYYFLTDEKYLYIGYLDYQTYSKLNSEDIYESPITIKGLTKTIPEDIIDIAIEVYNENLEEAFLTKENYKSYIGEICIDTVSDLADNIFQIIIASLFFIISIIYLLIYYSKKHRIYKMKKDTILWNEIQEELGHQETIEYLRFSTYLTPNYIMDGSKGFVRIAYSDIVWVYLNEKQYNGIIGERNLIVITKDKKRFMVARLDGIRLKVWDIYSNIMKDIYEKNQDILIGYTKENKKQARDLYQIK